MKKTVQLNISGMTCASCVLHIESDLKELKGVEEAVVNLPLKRANVVYDSEKATVDGILKTVKKSGYKAELSDEHHGHHEKREDDLDCVLH